MLKLKIEGEQKLGTLKSDFHTYYPYLKLEFFNKVHDVSEASAKKQMITKDEKIDKIRKSSAQGYFEVPPALTVSELEMGMRDQFDLNVQVFRKSGSVWLETSSTDHMTLKEQNELGLEKSHPAEQPDITNIDYD